MSLEISNRQDLYPFDLNRAEATSGQLAVANYIRSIRLCVQSNMGFTAKLKQVTASGLSIELKNTTNAQDIIVVSVPFTGVINCNDSRLLKNNSYVSFIEANRNNVVQDTYDITFLPQIMLYVPTGLIVHCTYSPVTATAQAVDKEQQVNRHTFQDSIYFISGYNFQPTQANASLILVGGTALGKGIIPVQKVKEQLGQEYAGGNFKYTYGIYSINGQTKNINIATQGSCIYMRQSLQNNKLTLELSNIQPGEQ